jgi:hypothetical protein
MWQRLQVRRTIQFKQCKQHPQSWVLYFAIMKELVEHIRTIHFTILVVALALTAALQIEPRRPLERAAADAEAILLLSQRWDETFKAIDKAVNEEIDSNAPLFPDERKVIVEPKLHYHVQTVIKGTGLLSIGFVGSSRWALIQREADNSYHTTDYLNYWQTLNDFRSFWDGVVGAPLFVPVVLSRSDPTDTSCGNLRFDRGNGKKETDVASDVFPEANFEYKVISRHGSRTWSMQPELHYFIGRRGTTEPISETCLFQPVDVEAVDVNMGRMFQPLTPEAAHWGNGPSSSEFPELIAASNYLEDTPLQNLASALRDRANADTERVEVFQAQIPASAIPSFGSLILILCELYLLAHLLELRNLIKSSRPSEWPSGYIGLYSNLFIFSFTIVTLAILPLIPLIWSAIRNTGSTRILSVAASAISLFLGVGCSWILFSIRKRHLVVPPHSTA